MQPRTQYAPTHGTWLSDLRVRRLATVVALIVLTALLAACATSPTGRRQLMLVPDKDMDRLGEEAMTQIKAQEKASTNAAVNQYVKCVSRAITAEVQSNKSWDIVVFESETVNAFALPSGDIGVYTGMLGVAKTQAQLAAVIAHEVGHVIARHGGERVSEQIALSTGLSAIEALIGGGQNARVVMGALGVGATYGVVLPHSRTQESEADEIGLELMARAGFDPRQAVQLWKNMKALGGSPPEFLSTHPSHQTRIRDLEKQMAEVMPLYEQARAAGKKPSCKRP